MRSHIVDPLNIYGDIFAEVYNLYWTEFIDEIGPQIVKIIDQQPGENKRVLDLCCGTGRLSDILLTAGYQVTGVDLSPDMIDIAHRRCQSSVTEGKARFVVGNATSFELEADVGHIVSTFDSLNHLKNLDELEQCFQRSHETLEDGGLFIFDINTKQGLKKWEFVDLEDHGDVIFIMHGKYDRKDKRAYTRVYGFKQGDRSTCYQKFDEIMSNTVFEISSVAKLLETKGFEVVRITEELDLFSEVENPEEHDRVFIISQKIG